MDAQNVTHPNVELALHRDEEQGLYLLGVVLHGEFIPLLSHKLARSDKWAGVGRDRQASQPAEQPAQPEQTQPAQ